jgi:hypothetical protein
VCELADALDEHPAVAWPDCVAQLAAADEVLRRTANPLVGLMVPCRQSLEQNWRDLLGTVRLLRVAIGLHLGEELLVKDPFACGSLTVERQGRLACVAYTSPGQRPRQRLVQLDTEPAPGHR